jgi:hypothetical protein
MIDRRACVFVLAVGCATNTKSDADRDPPGAGFQTDHTVQITSPVDGETTADAFTVVYTAGVDVAEVTLSVGDGSETGTPVDGGGSIDVSGLDDGHNPLLLTGYDDAGVQVGTHQISVRITEPEGPWVTITSPADGAEPTNPVVFAVNASDSVDSIELIADDWSLGTVSPGQILTYEFSGTGFARTIEAQGWAGDEMVATDEIQITVQEAEEVPLSDMNAVIWTIAQSYPTDGTHTYYWPSEGTWAGTTQDIWYRDELVAEGDPDGRCFCVGLTWEVYMQAFDQLDEETSGDGTLNGLTVDDLYSFRTDFYVRELLGSGVVEAFDNYGLGETVTDWEDAQQGDIIQLWRYNSTGHSVLFHSWERDLDGSIQGLTYWSTQSSTDGIDVNTEWFGTSEWDINPSYLYIARPWAPVDWLPW